MSHPDAGVDSPGDPRDLVADLLYAEVNDLCDQHMPLIETADSKLLDLAHMVTNKVFTHRLSRIEAESGELICEFDLWPLSGFETLHLGITSTGSDEPGATGADGDGLVEIRDDPYTQRWSHPSWKGAFTEGSTVAITIDDDARARITVLAESPPTNPQTLESLRSAYELHCEATDLPPTSDLLAAEMLLDEPTIFDEPTAPLSRYAKDLGLEIRRSLGADESAQWRVLASAERETQAGPRVRREDQ